MNILKIDVSAFRSCNSNVRLGQIVVRPLRLIAIVVVAIAGVVACANKGGSQVFYDSEAQFSEFGDADKGLAYAEENCSTCHELVPNQFPKPNAGAPTFESLANRPDMTRRTLRLLLTTPHRRMPGLMIGSENIDDIAAYIETLRYSFESG